MGGGGQTCRSCVCIPLGGSGGIPSPPRKIWNFRHSVIVSRAIRQALQQSPVHCCYWATKVAAKLVPEGSPVLDLNECTTFSAKIAYARSTWPCRFSSVGINRYIGFCTYTAYTRGTFYKAPSKNFCVIDTQVIRSHHVHAHEACM